jgi:integrase
MRRGRSGSHLELIGDIWYYRRKVPDDALDAFGKTVVRVSLNTSSKTEARRLEKPEDVKFEDLLNKVREREPNGPLSDPGVRRAVITYKLLSRSHPELANHVAAFQSEEHFDGVLSKLSLLDRMAVDQELEIRREDYIQWQTDFWNSKIDNSNPSWMGLDNDGWNAWRNEIIEAIRNHLKSRSNSHTIDWAYGEWLKSKTRPAQTHGEAKRYLDDFKASARVRTLPAIRRAHVVGWREELKRGGDLAATSINHRLEIVSAILRTGWRNAEMTAPDLSRINLPEDGSSGRGAWEKEELLKALGGLEPHSGMAWLFVIGLTTSTRIGETVAARKRWYNRNGFIEVPKEFTKMKKPHVVPIIDLIREPFTEHLRRLNDDDFMFDAPRPNNPKLKIGHEASKWFSRFHKRHGIPRVIHELRHTWIACARYDSPLKEEVWEIISGHSKKTVADGYGGEKPLKLMAANETICKDLLDADLIAAVRRLID